MWQAIAYVSGGFTLAAFAGAVAAWTLRVALVRKEGLIKTAPEADRAKLVDAALESFRVDTASLTKQQKFDIALAQIRSRDRRFVLATQAVSFAGVLLAAVSVFSIAKAASPASTGPTVIAPPASTAAADPMPCVKYQERVGVWQVNCFQADAGFFWRPIRPRVSSWGNAGVAWPDHKDETQKMRCNADAAANHDIGYSGAFPVGQVGGGLTGSHREWVEVVRTQPAVAGGESPDDICPPNTDCGIFRFVCEPIPLPK